jgi:S-adenosylmethionine hydrolase
VHRVSASAPFIAFLSDYGLSDEFVGVCHGVIAMRCPSARVIDLTHSIPPHDVLAGALTLRDSLRYLPPGVHLAVVDPGVGAHARGAVALRTQREARLLVGPDNGLLMPAAQALAGAVQAVEISRSPERLRPVSATFHGRDIFAPVAAALASGTPLSAVGEPLDPSTLIELAIPVAQIGGGALHARVLSTDRFGNLALDATPGQLEELGLSAGAGVTIEVSGHPTPAVIARTFADVDPGALLLYVDARGTLAAAVREGSAAKTLGLQVGQKLTVRPA